MVSKLITEHISINNRLVMAELNIIQSATVMSDI